jgi:hypothetical protein
MVFFRSKGEDEMVVEYGRGVQRVLLAPGNSRCCGVVGARIRRPAPVMMAVVRRAAGARKILEQKDAADAMILLVAIYRRVVDESLEFQRDRARG